MTPVDNSPKPGARIASAELAAASRFRRCVGGLLFVRRAVTLLPVGLFALGTVLLLLRVSGLHSLGVLSWGGVVVCASAILGGAWELRKTPSPEKAAAFLDAWNRSGGLLVSAQEGMELRDWAERLPAPALPALRWRGRRALGFIALAMFYLAAVLVVPAKYVVPGWKRPLEIGESVARIRTAIEVLEQERILPEKQTGDLQRKLERISSEATGLDPAKTWQSLDHLAEAVERAAQEQAENDLAALEAAAAAETLSKALAAAGGNLNPRDGKAAKEKLTALLKALGKTPTAAENLPGDLLDKLAKEGGLSEAELRKLAAGG